jgi:thiol-disulfide isomerase/thioredoxin
MKKLLSSLLLASSLLFAEAVTIPTVNKTPITMDINGEHIDFQGYQGKYVLLEFFGTRCPMCAMELEHLKSMQKNNPELEVIAVELQNTPKDTLSDYIFENDINYPVIDFQNAYTLYMFAKNAAPKWKGGIPMTILFDKNGQALTYFVGVITETDILNAIKEYGK